MTGQILFTPAAVMATMLERYGLDGAVVQLPSYDDHNFLLTRPDGERFVLKTYRFDIPDALVDLEVALLNHLQHSDRPALFPRVVSALDGAMTITVSDQAGRAHLARLVTFLPGQLLAQKRPHSPALLRDLGCCLADMDRALAHFSHPAAARVRKWDLARFLDWQPMTKYIPAGPRRDQVDRCFEAFERDVAPVLPALRQGVIHNDANDYNILLAAGTIVDPAAVSAFIDFGDVVHTAIIFELATCLAYALMGKADPLRAAANVVAGYHARLPLTEQEVALLPALVAARLATSLLSSSRRQAKGSADEYTLVSQAPAWNLLTRWQALPVPFVTAALRHACGLAPWPAGPAITTWLSDQRSFFPVIDETTYPGGRRLLDLGVGSPDLTGRRAADMPAAAASFLARALPADTLGLGAYGEARLLYRADAFAVPSDELPERRTRHLGVDLFLPAGTPVYAPLAGRIHSLADNDAPQEYGPAILVEHNPAPGIRFLTLYGHLDRESLAHWRADDTVRAGALVGRVGAAAVNGGWPPHLHFQLLLNHFGPEGTFPGVVVPHEWPIWSALCPDPNLLLRLPELAAPAVQDAAVDLLRRRTQRLGPSLSPSYRRPLHVVRGLGQYLYDADGREYLDGVNNVCHVGHAHPVVNRALQRQAGVLNTNTRYLHKNVVEYAERLTATLPEPLRVCFFVCSGSEANELALRLARAATGRSGVIVIDGAYHGNTSALVDISPYKFDGPGGAGRPDHVRVAPMPDLYRGAHRGPEAGAAYAAGVADAAAELSAADVPPAAFIAESLLGCGGQIPLPDGYLASAFAHARDAGAVCIADEIQVGFGRVGTHFWGFERQGVTPDIVTMGKPIGNGHPLAAVVTTPDIAATFADGMEYFNTFGGNPVSCAVGMAVLDVLESEGLQAHAEVVGSQLLEDLRFLQSDHPIIGDVRGAGLFIGIEFVEGRATLAPAALAAAYVVERLRDHGILLSTDGPLHNVIKIKPPLPFTGADAGRLVTSLQKVLAELG